MCVPDLRGSQGTFTFYTSDEKSMDNRMGGVQIPVKAVANKIHTYIPGPENTWVN